MVPMAALLEQCAPQVSPVLMQALVRAESAGQAYAIGMDSSHGSVKQPATLAEAVRTARQLAGAGRKFSVGLAQVHVSNVTRYGLSWEQAFDPCQNLAAGQKILWHFYHRASASGYSGVAAIWAALRGYNSGGVHRTVSDDYAHRIFAYMSSAPPAVQIGRGIPAIAAGARPAAGDSPQAGTVPAPALTSAPAPPSGSLDIFQKTQPAGF